MPEPKRKVVGYRAILVTIDEDARYKVSLQSGQPGEPTPRVALETAETIGVEGLEGQLRWAVAQLVRAERCLLS